jgi:large subunit ribosomal protein L35
MPKLKTHKGAARRFKVTSTGKVMHRKGHISHLRTAMSRNAQSQVDKNQMGSKPLQKRVHLLLPYS